MLYKASKGGLSFIKQNKKNLWDSCKRRETKYYRMAQSLKPWPHSSLWEHTLSTHSSFQGHLKRSPFVHPPPNEKLITPLPVPTALKSAPWFHTGYYAGWDCLPKWDPPWGLRQGLAFGSINKRRVKIHKTSPFSSSCFPVSKLSLQHEFCVNKEEMPC